MTARTASLLAGTEVIIFSYPQPQVSVAVLHYTLLFIASFPCASQGRKLHKVNLSLSKHAIELILNCANPMLWSIYGPLSSKTILVAKDPVEVININA